MVLHFQIKDSLPGLNEFLAAQKQNNRRYFAGNAMKRKWEQIISAYIPKEMKGLNITAPCEIYFIYYEKDKRRDPDNISGTAHKFILDTLVKEKVLKDDSQRYIKKIHDEYRIDKKHPRIEVGIITRNAKYI